MINVLLACCCVELRACVIHDIANLFGQSERAPTHARVHCHDVECGVRWAAPNCRVLARSAVCELLLLSESYDVHEVCGILTHCPEGWRLWQSVQEHFQDEWMCVVHSSSNTGRDVRHSIL